MAPMPAVPANAASSSFSPMFVTPMGPWMAPMGMGHPWNFWGQGYGKGWWAGKGETIADAEIKKEPVDVKKEIKKEPAPPSTKVKQEKLEGGKAMGRNRK